MTHPYRDKPSYTRWSQSVTAPAYGDVDPVVRFPFRLQPTDKVATAGSCFAQHIARRLRADGFNYFVTEPGHVLASQEVLDKYHYGVFSARYANIYTPRQLVQTIERAYGERTLAVDHWVTADGSYLDPVRPAIEPEGFSSLEELRADREQHHAAVRRMFEELDYFVFTLGLTECFVDTVDGTVFPVAPGVAGGEYDLERHRFHNFGVVEVVDDMRRAIDRIRAVNPGARFILTVSPVPLIATAEDQHVLVSTTYSKSVLRVACSELVRHDGDVVAYFPSYEIIVGGFNRGRYFADDLREVVPEGVDHVMRTFMRAVSGGDYVPAPPAANSDASLERLRRLEEMQRTVCEEALLEAATERE